MASRPFFDDPPPALPAAPQAPPRIREADSGGAAPVRWAKLLVRGRQEDAAWVRPSLIGLLGIAALLYLWDLGASGWANAFYSAAVQAGSTSWKAFFFGSFDASNFITVDKSPAALWVMDLSARLFGVNAWSILVPQALEGVATVGFTYLTVRRWFSPAAALIAGATVALTPVAALMFRFDNPDALLVLLLTVATYATVRAVEAGKTKWLVLAATLVGFAFLTKMLQAFLVVPAFGLVYLVAAPVSLRRRIAQLAIAAGAMVVASGWWVAIVQLTPAADRPYIGGSQNNSILNLIFGYNGFGRLTGNESGSVGGAGTSGRWGPTGLTRLFGSEMGTQISWLLPAALILLAVGLVMTLRRARTDRTRAAFILWGGSLVVSALVFSLAAGIIHPYYTVALAPAIGALVGIGSVLLWRERSRTWARLVLAGTVAVTSIWSVVLLERSPDFAPGLAPAVAILGVGAAIAIAGIPLLHRRVVAGVLAVGMAAAFAGPAAYTIDTVLTAHSGAIPSAGPTITAATTGGGAGGVPGGFAGRGAAGPFPGGFGRGGFLPGGGFGNPGGFTGRGGFPRGAGAGGGGFGGGGGFLNASTPGAALVTLLQTNAGQYSWVAATIDANSAAGYQLATDDPIMAIGGFNGTDPAPSLAQFEQYVAQGRIHYFIGSGRTPGGSTNATSSQIAQWVEQHFTATTVDGVTVYDLTQPAA